MVGWWLGCSVGCNVGCNVRDDNNRGLRLINSALMTFNEKQKRNERNQQMLKVFYKRGRSYIPVVLVVLMAVEWAVRLEIPAVGHGMI